MRPLWRRRSVGSGGRGQQVAGVHPQGPAQGQATLPGLRDPLHEDEELLHLGQPGEVANVYL